MSDKKKEEKEIRRTEAPNNRGTPGKLLHFSLTPLNKVIMRTIAAAFIENWSPDKNST